MTDELVSIEVMVVFEQDEVFVTVAVPALAVLVIVTLVETVVVVRSAALLCVMVDVMVAPPIVLVA